MENSIQHLIYFLRKIFIKEPIAIIRPCDGEYLIMKNNYFSNTDNWTFKGGILREDLLNIKKTIKNLNNIFVGIPCPECQGFEMFKNMIEILELQPNQITYANIFCNRNWNYFINFLTSSFIPFNYIGPTQSFKNVINIKNILTIDPLLVDNWDTKRDSFITELFEWISLQISNNQPKLFLFAAGPITKVVIPMLYSKFSDCQFIDVGSSLDFFTKGISNRQYIQPNQTYSNQICSFISGHNLHINDTLPQSLIDFFINNRINDIITILDLSNDNYSKTILKILNKLSFEQHIYTTYTNTNFDFILINDSITEENIIDFTKNISDKTIIFVNNFNKIKNLLAQYLEIDLKEESDWVILRDIKVLSNITAILNVFKRPQNLKVQINFLKNQTIKPKQIIIWKNYSENIVIPNEIKEDKSILIIESSENLGVWPRFLIGLLANTEYICVFDDDTIPGKCWFENCLKTMSKVNGLLGTVGLIFNSKEEYYSHSRHGWSNPHSDILQVDIVGHSWFFRKKWILELYNILPDLMKYKIVGEDMGLSWALQQIGINTYVPPHPINNLDLFGSLPNFAWSFGTDNVSIHKSEDIKNKFNDMYKFFIERGFKFVKI
jgi:hypothetical protein